MVLRVYLPRTQYSGRAECRGHRYQGRGCDIDKRGRIAEFGIGTSLTFNARLRNTISILVARTMFTVRSVFWGSFTNLATSGDDTGLTYVDATCVMSAGVLDTGHRDADDAPSIVV